MFFFFFQAEDGIRDLVRSRGLGDVYKRQVLARELPVRLGDRIGREERLLRRVRHELARARHVLSLIHI